MSTLQLTQAKQNNQNCEIQKQETETLRQIDQSCCSSGQVTTAPHWLRWRVCAQVHGSDLTEDDRGHRGRTICGLVCVLMCVCVSLSRPSAVWFVCFGELTTEEVGGVSRHSSTGSAGWTHLWRTETSLHTHENNRYQHRSTEQDKTFTTFWGGRDLTLKN